MILGPFTVPVDEEVESQHLKFMQNQPAGMSFAEATSRFNSNISYSGLLHAVTADVSPAKVQVYPCCLFLFMVCSLEFCVVRLIHVPFCTLLSMYVTYALYPALCDPSYSLSLLC